MDQVLKVFGTLFGAFLLLEVLAILYPKFPRIPGDIYLDKIGLKIYIPFTSAIVISVAITLLMHILGK